VTDDPILSALPDDIEQFLIKDQRLRAIFALAERRGISFEAASDVVRRWLSDRQQPIERRKPYGRRKDDRPT
jgi:hypothetical protein